jgi:geranylgeranyl diphosphate synthase type I
VAEREKVARLPDRGAWSGSYPVGPLNPADQAIYDELGPKVPFDKWISTVRRSVEAHLGSFFIEKRWQAAALSEPSVVLVDAVARFTLRGGKRTRPALLMAGHAAVTDEPVFDLWLDVSAGLELLHSYLLIHDDWMDQDDERRGAMTLHREFSQGDSDAHRGASLAILAGDLACAFATELVCGSVAFSGRCRAALEVFWGMQQDVVWGQGLDVVGYRDVGLIHRLKTGSYTVRGPLMLGAVLGGGDLDQCTALEHYAEPAGRAFQVRDDLLGVFGDRATTGKPRGTDLRAGKQTAVTEEAGGRLSAKDRAKVMAVFGRADAEESLVLEAIQALERAGVRAAMEEQLQGLCARALSALEGSPLRPAGAERLRELVKRLANRDR